MIKTIVANVLLLLMGSIIGMLLEKNRKRSKGNETLH